VKLLLAGRFAYAWYEHACAEALEELGHDIVRFEFGDMVAGIWAGLEEGLSLPGPATRRLNSALISAVVQSKPDVVLIWRGTQILPGTLRTLKHRTGAALVSYNNDDPFSPAYKRVRWHRVRQWRCFKQCIPEYDLHFVYRPINVSDYVAAGARRVEVLLPYFVPSMHRPVRLSADERSRYASDVVFVGHYEEDDRVRYLESLAQAGLTLKLFGPHWPQRVIRRLFRDQVEVRPVMGDEYAKALGGSRACLSFHSRLNRDTYTRRSFEIPACEGLLLSERTDDLKELFAEDKEALYFSSPEELVSKALWVVRNDDAAKLIRRRARERCIRDGHDVLARMRQMVSLITAVC
jgi:spore maturation protein CgeB